MRSFGFHLRSGLPSLLAVSPLLLALPVYRTTALPKRPSSPCKAPTQSSKLTYSVHKGQPVVQPFFALKTNASSVEISCKQVSVCDCLCLFRDESSQSLVLLPFSGRSCRPGSRRAATESRNASAAAQFHSGLALVPGWLLCKLNK